VLVERLGRVSVWVGRFADESALRSYVETTYDGDEATCPFWTETGTDWFDEDFLEAEFHPEGLPTVGLVAAHSYGPSFAAPVDAAIRRIAVRDATAVIVAYDADYAPSDEASPGPLRFVGSFDYQKSESPAAPDRPALPTTEPPGCQHRLTSDPENPRVSFQAAATPGVFPDSDPWKGPSPADEISARR
jgi:hypothetical protein